ncbi:cell division protein FtsN [[Haemophilus] ducreyi]|uniref:cell division protein FtsN n=1 Tax=Haemophilus ducreyi TaxID=730 RepID=UPI00065604A2|nr:cell division protein FtsN [[Haemophilus] ducreyi]AKO45115.1 cell division protein FtsN [[Haemophilus] ducreyi]AKO46517.1 cell division protein FtsN [[Haemophilus] ducreyi]AKO47859.1 cell division protein FtsN [[Haemophilus] ducreyi]AKO49246.1 cell division protein FtsN [[Haemophilus] ducreyi]ANF61754.1 cell division protein FtsN [[Haemophilus] ducreyi]
MTQHDYAVRLSKKKTPRRSLILISVIIILILFGGSMALWLLKEHAPATAIPVEINKNKTLSSPSLPTLPTRPEEVYSYIRDLETREVLTDNSEKSQEKLAQLSAKQKQQLEERLRQEAARLNAENPAQEEQTEKVTAITPTETVAVNHSVEQAETTKTVEQEKIAKTDEAKPKQTELKKQQEQPQKNEVPIETAKVAKVQPKPIEKPAHQNGQFGLQCGAFKNKAQAENMQARLTILGFNARINASATWNRVIVGPFNDRNAAVNAQANVEPMAECVIISM